MARPALMFLSPGQIAYAGYVFPVSFMLSEIDYDLQLNATDIPFAAGSYTPAGKQNPKTYTVSGTYGGLGAVLDAQGSNMVTMDQLQDELDRLFGVMLGGEQALQWRPDRYSLAQMYQPKLTYNTGQGYRFVDLSIGFTANDPRSFSYNEYAAAVQSTASGLSNSTSLSNQGSDRAYPVVTLSFQSTCVNPSFSIGTNQAGQFISCSLVGAFSTTDLVVITTDPRSRSITRNGVKTWSILNIQGIVNTIVGDTSVFPFISPNSASCPFTASASSGQVTALAMWQDTWA
jgi:hypothetical protein